MVHFNVQNVQRLHQDDYSRQGDIVKWMLGMRNNYSSIPALVFRCDDKTISKDGIFNMRNQHVFCDSNPHCNIPHKYQHTFFLIIRAGIVAITSFALTSSQTV